MGSYLHRRPLQHSLTSFSIIIVIITMIAIIMAGRAKVDRRDDTLLTGTLQPSNISQKCLETGETTKPLELSNLLAFIEESDNISHNLSDNISHNISDDISDNISLS